MELHRKNAKGRHEWLLHAVTWFVISGLPLTWVGCITPRSTPPNSEMPVHEEKLYDDRAAEQEIEQARRLIEAEQYTVVIPRLLHTLNKYPSTKAAKDARYWLAVAYYNVQSYRDAIDMFKEYIDMAPNGQHAEESKAYAAKLREEYQQKFPPPSVVNEKIQSLSAKIKANPGDIDAQLELANLLWQRGSYEDAGRVYMAVLKQQPELEDEPPIVHRVERVSNGEYLLLTPQEIQEQQLEEKPLQIINVNSFRSGRDIYTQVPRFYVVTGQSYNRSDSVLYSVQVHVTIYGFGNVVYDTRTVNIGRLNPGEIRAFSVRFSNFDDINNIQRYECVGDFQR